MSNDGCHNENNKYQVYAHHMVRMYCKGLAAVVVSLVTAVGRVRLRYASPHHITFGQRSWALRRTMASGTMSLVPRWVASTHAYNTHAYNTHAYNTHTALVTGCEGFTYMATHNNAALRRHQAAG